MNFRGRKVYQVINALKAFECLDEVSEIKIIDLESRVLVNCEYSEFNNAGKYSNEIVIDYSYNYTFDNMIDEILFKIEV